MLEKRTPAIRKTSFTRRMRLDITQAGGKAADILANAIYLGEGRTRRLIKIRTRNYPTIISCADGPYMLKFMKTRTVHCRMNMRVLRIFSGTD